MCSQGIKQECRPTKTAEAQESAPESTMEVVLSHVDDAQLIQAHQYLVNVTLEYIVPQSKFNKAGHVMKLGRKCTTKLVIRKIQVACWGIRGAE